MGVVHGRDAMWYRAADLGHERVRTTGSGMFRCSGVQVFRTRRQGLLVACRRGETMTVERIEDVGALDGPRLANWTGLLD